MSGMAEVCRPPVQGDVGVLAFADELRAAGHTVHTPDLFDGCLFDTIDEGMAHVEETGFGTMIERADGAADALPAALVYAGFSFGVMPAQKLAQTRPGALGALLFESFVPPSEFGSWPADVPAQIHGMDADPFFAGEGDLDAARAFVGSSEHAELFVYPGDRHLSRPSLASFEKEATALLQGGARLPRRALRGGPPQCVDADADLDEATRIAVLPSCSTHRRTTCSRWSIA